MAKFEVGLASVDNISESAKTEVLLEPYRAIFTESFVR
jgi:hypothetical protein